MKPMAENGMSRARIFFVLLLVALGAGGCDVQNPGPVGDEFIDLPASQAGLVKGSWERLNKVIGYGAFDEGLPAREMFPGGQTGTYGQSVSRQAGNMGGWSSSGPYNNAQQARWIAEEAIRRFTARGDVSKSIMANAYLAAGYASRVNGDFFCWGVIDGGKLFEGPTYWKNAEAHFTNALASAQDATQRNAAYAGRAQARLSLEDWTGALADAKQVPSDFVYWLEMDFSRGGDITQQNQLVYASGYGTSYRSFTIRFTFFDKYYAETGDPRTPWRDYITPSDRNCVAAVQGFGGSVPCIQQMKYMTRDDDMKLASGGEMRMIEAEAMMRLNPSSWPQAVAILNANRARYINNITTGLSGGHTTVGGTAGPLKPWTANNLDDAWTILMRERGIEFWLEARRFADLRRWERYIRAYSTFGPDGQTVIDLPKTTPGTLDWPCFECVMVDKNTNIFTSNNRGRPANQNGADRPRELCYNISDQERANNPNLLEQGDDITP
jgi:starch-binding outer membrane protein, SusD/RagB family